MATLTKDIQSKIRKLSGKRDGLPEQLAKVRGNLEEARAELGAAALDGGDVGKRRDRVATLQAEETGLVEALSIADRRLDGLGGDLKEAERAELQAAFQEASERLGAQGEAVLAQLFDALDWAKAAIGEYRQLQYQAGQHENFCPPAGDLYQIQAFATEVYVQLLTLFRSAGLRYTMGGGPKRFALLGKRRWDY
jgi:chromosome segregation ATPase